MYSEKLHSEILIKAPIEDVFAFLTTPLNIPLVLPGLIENTNVPSSPLKAGSEFHYRYQMFGVVTEGTTIIDRIENNSAYDFSTTGGNMSHWLERLTTVDGQTKVSVDVEYDPPASWSEKVQLGVVRTLLPRELDRFLDNVKILLELRS